MKKGRALDDFISAEYIIAIMVSFRLGLTRTLIFRVTKHTYNLSEKE